MLKNWCFWALVLEKTVKCPMDYKGIKPVNPKGNQSWIFIGRTDAEAEAPILWPSDVKSWLIRKDPDAGKDWRQEEKGTTEDEMVGWHQRLMDMSLSKLGRWWRTGKPGVLQPMGLRRLDTIEQLNKENSEGHDNGDLIHFDLKSWSKLGWDQSCRYKHAWCEL